MKKIGSRTERDPSKSDLKSAEQAAHDRTYSALEGEIAAATPEAYRAEIARPPYLDHGALNGTINRRFLDRVTEEMDQLADQEPVVLDYGCGMGGLSVYLAQTNPKARVCGFDLSTVGTRAAGSLAERSGVSSRVSIAAMDGEAIAYRDHAFDLVVGKSVMHHTIKYPKTASELHRIMKPGSLAIFKENLGNSPILRLARFFTMKVFGDHGDVNITSGQLRHYASAFRSIEIDAWSFLFMGKRLLWKPGVQSATRKRMMKALEAIDDATVHRSHRLRRALCGEAIFILRK